MQTKLKVLALALLMPLSMKLAAQQKAACTSMEPTKSKFMVRPKPMAGRRRFYTQQCH
jgi:hypothetical protein